MKQISKILVFISVLFLGANFSQAEGLITFGLDFDNTTFKSTTPSATDSKSDFMGYSLGAGIVMSGGLYLGAVYETDSTKTVSGSTTETKGTAMGLGLGYITGNWSFILDYFVNAAIEQVDSYEYTGTGLGVDVGYGFSLGGSTKLGVKLAYRSYTFDKYKATPASTEVETDYAITEMEPGIFLAWKI